MAQNVNDNISETTKSVQPPPVLLDYGCTPWRFSSQRVADLYDSGVKLWTKTDLQDIERQLERSNEVDRFTVRGVDGRIVQIKNPLVGVQKPIWYVSAGLPSVYVPFSYVISADKTCRNPSISFKEYWKLVTGEFDGDPDALYCSYVVGWKNQLARDFRGNIEDWQRLFESKSQLWNASITCMSFMKRLGEVLVAQKVTKIICFGLGDIARQPPEAYTASGQEAETDSHGAEIHPGMIQHAAALTMAEEVRRLCGGSVRLLTQDPQYTDDTQEYLRTKGFEIVGKFGAEGFSHIDDQCIVFTAWPAAPVKQIVADIARPVAFITLSDRTNPFNRFK